MDIPVVLDALGLSALNWGPNANSNNTYAQFASTWPVGNPTIPTEAAMEAKWAEIVANAPAAALLQAQIDALAAIINQFGQRVPMETTADVTTTSNLPASVTGLGFPINKNENWHATFDLFVVGSAAGMKFALSGPASPVSVVLGCYGGVSGVAPVLSSASGFSTPTNNAHAPGGAQFGYVRCAAHIANGANAGNVQLLFASSTNGQTNKIIARSFGLAWRAAV